MSCEDLLIASPHNGALSAHHHALHVASENFLLLKQQALYWLRSQGPRYLALWDRCAAHCTTEAVASLLIISGHVTWKPVVTALGHSPWRRLKLENHLNSWIQALPGQHDENLFKTSKQKTGKQTNYYYMELISSGSRTFYSDVFWSEHKYWSSFSIYFWHWEPVLRDCTVWERIHLWKLGLVGRALCPQKGNFLRGNVGNSSVVHEIWQWREAFFNV